MNDKNVDLALLIKCALEAGAKIIKGNAGFPAGITINGKPIDMDEMKFFSGLERLNIAAKEESPEIRTLVKEIVTTYHPANNEADSTEEHKEMLKQLAEKINTEE